METRRYTFDFVRLVFKLHLQGEEKKTYLLPILRLDPHVLRTDLPRSTGLKWFVPTRLISTRVVSLNFVSKSIIVHIPVAQLFFSSSSSATDGDGDPWLARWCPFVPAHRGAEQRGKASSLRASFSLRSRLVSTLRYLGQRRGRSSLVPPLLTCPRS